MTIQITCQCGEVWTLEIEDGQQAPTSLPCCLICKTIQSVRRSQTESPRSWENISVGNARYSEK